ncbi:MAG: hypothetical protein GF308_20190 [Candidatus Heimdallarchaeota archaeon]|nr:hypothetical protein [Candidatus Heimdallarchaeota archaeon]
MTDKFLDRYMKEYDGLNDYYLPIFELINKKYIPRKVLYPGSYIHITPSLVFPYVVYVDFTKGVKGFFKDESVLSFIENHKSYEESPELAFYFSDYRSNFLKIIETYDLLISLNAGLISTACKKHLRKGGLLLVNDEHYDARTAFVDNDFRFIAVYDKSSKDFNYSQAMLKKYFKTKKGLTITSEMIKDSITKSPSKDPYKTKFQSAFYLFEKK